MSKIIVKGLKKDCQEQELVKAIQEVFLQSTDNLSWLKPGDSVLLKPAINSFDPYPATTHPLTIKAISDILRGKGASVLVGDQSGIEHVVQDENGVVRGSSEECFQASQQCVAAEQCSAGTVFKAFEKENWNSGFFKFKSEKAESWPNGFYATDWINRVDHIINLPRLSTHAQAGVTLGFKNMVGILRLDSRMDFHANGPLNYFAKANAKGSKLVSNNDKKNAFFEKIVEISLALQEKLRLTLFVGTEAQVTLGPDKYVLEFLGKRIMPSFKVVPETGLVFASTDQVTAEVMGIALLALWYKEAPVSARFWQKVLGLMNNQAKELGTYNVWDNPFVKHGLRLGLGSGQMEIKYDQVPDALQNKINNLIKRG